MKTLTVLEPSTVSQMLYVMVHQMGQLLSSGGTAPYTYLWDDGQTTAMAGALTAGSL